MSIWRCALVLAAAYAHGQYVAIPAFAACNSGDSREAGSAYDLE